MTVLGQNAKKLNLECARRPEKNKLNIDTINVCNQYGKCADFLNCF